MLHLQTKTAMTQYKNSLEFAKEQDAKDPLAKFRDEFYFPQNNQNQNQIYLCGNSLGLQPKRTQKYINQELKDWAKYGVEGHTLAKNPWVPYHELLTNKMAKIVGAKPKEVVMMNTLTVNLHLMMVSFYRPTDRKFKILIEKDAFPSDRYAVESQLRFHGISPEEGLLLWEPPEGEELCRFEDLQKIIEEQGNRIALMMIGSTNYYTGQSFPLKKIVQLGHQHEINVGFDLAHGAGNIQPNLHKTGADFAVWCSYKYLNSGPGSVGGCFVHERHENDLKLPRFAGWWGHDKESRFNMRQDFDPIPGAEGWQLSNPPILSLAAINASLSLFEEAGFDKLIQKSKNLTGYLEFLIKDLQDNRIQIITPSNFDERGCQLSLKLTGVIKSLFDNLIKDGVITDWREPNVIRIAPAPLYNNYEDVFKMVQSLKKHLG